MNGQNRSIINKLLANWPKNTVAVSSWLEGQSVYRQLAGTYVKSGWIERIGKGAFKRADENVDWSGGLYTLQEQLNMSVHPAGKRGTAHQGAEPLYEGGRLHRKGRERDLLPPGGCRNSLRRNRSREPGSS